MQERKGMHVCQDTKHRRLHSCACLSFSCLKKMPGMVKICRACIMHSELQRGRGKGVSGVAHEAKAALKVSLRRVVSLTLIEAGTVIP